MEEHQQHNHQEEHQREHEKITIAPREKKGLKESIKEIYEHKYKALLLIPFILLFLAFIQLGIQTATTGDFLIRDVSLKGGLALTFSYEDTLDRQGFEKTLSQAFPENDISVRVLARTGNVIGFTINGDIDVTENEKITSLVAKINEFLGTDYQQGDYTVEFIGSSLGESFFRETLIALLIAFVFMGAVVFLYFRQPAPSIAVILAAFSDMVITLAIVNMFGFKLGSAGIAAFLMLIGYSVDTDILLSTRVLKHKEGTVMDRIYSAMNTGVTMTVTTLSAVLIALILSPSGIIKQIMAILLIGLLVDLIMTWIQNVGLLRIFIERKKHETH